MTEKITEKINIHAELLDELIEDRKDTQDGGVNLKCDCDCDCAPTRQLRVALPVSSPLRRVSPPVRAPIAVRPPLRRVPPIGVRPQSGEVTPSLLSPSIVWPSQQEELLRWSPGEGSHGEPSQEGGSIYKQKYFKYKKKYMNLKNKINKKYI